MDRRGMLKCAIAVGATAPLGGVLAGVVPAQAQGGAKSLTSAQLAGQRVIFSFKGMTVPPSLLQQIRVGQAAGVIFFGENVSGESQLAAVIRQLRQAQQQSPVAAPLLLMTDQEGGEVRRLPGAPVRSEKQVGEYSDPAAAATTAGTGAGRNLAGVGMNVNLAPVLDVFSQAGNFIDEYDRSYSS